MPKVSIIGAGGVGTALAAFLLGEVDVVLVDAIEGLAEGRALDLSHLAAIQGKDTRVTGSTGYEQTAGSDIVVVAAGLARSHAMKRDGPLLENADIVRSVVSQALERSPGAVFIVITNPLDAMCHVALACGVRRERVLGMAGVLDSARMRTLIAAEAHISPSRVDALVIGSHSMGMVPLTRLAKVDGEPVSLNEEGIVSGTRGAGQRVISLTGASATLAPAAGAARMVSAILEDSQEVLPCSVLLEGEYGVEGLFLGVPVRLGAVGLLEVMELDLTVQEQASFEACAAHVGRLKRLLEEEKRL